MTTDTMTAMRKLQMLAELKEKHMPAARKRANRMDNAIAMMKETGCNNIISAIHTVATRNALAEFEAQ